MNILFPYETVMLADMGITKYKHCLRSFQRIIQSILLFFLPIRGIL